MLDKQAYLDNGLIIVHVVRELRDFDTTLRDVYFYDGPSVLNEFTSDSDVFGAWIEAERANSSDSYMEAIRDPSAFELAYDNEMFGPEDAKPSHVSERVVQLVENITERYSMLPSCMQQLEMLATTQFPIVIAFVEDIEAEIDEFSRISLAFMRDNTGVDQTQSPLFAQLRRLAAWYQAVWYVEEAADEWNNSTVFVDMWAAVCRYAAVQDLNADPRDWRESVDTWGEADQEILDAADDGEWTDNDEWLDGGIWERSVATLRELRQRISDLMSRALNKEAVSQLRAYRKANSWAPDTEDNMATTDLSPELSNFLRELSATIARIKTLVPAAARIRIVRSLAEELDGFLVQKVATAHQFNALGGHRLLKDVNAISHILTSAQPSTVPSTALHSRTLVKAKECALALACDLSGTDVSPTGESTMPVPLEEWGPIIRDSSSDKTEAGLLLKKLGIKHLSFKEVQQLVNRRGDFTRLQDSPQ
ncbi:hypothetical protein EC988_006029 [Linderina pennispora]|nr:hypothetical protein EC988_006029 [Linderina pennispora]